MRPLTRLPAARAALLLAAVPPTGCGAPDEEPGPDPSAYAAHSLVVGDWLDETWLLVLRREGGRAEVRSTTDPSVVEWRSDERLPGAQAAAELGPRSIVFATARGTLYRYDLLDGLIEEPVGVGPEAGWNAYEGRGAVWAGRGIAVVGDGVGRQHETAAPVRWAAPAPDGSVVALVSGEDGPVLLALGEGSEPAAELHISVLPLGIVTGWGRRALFLAADGREIVSIRLPELVEEGRFRFKRPVTAFTTSGSSHELYVALSGGDVEAVSRLGSDRRKLAELDGEVTELRPGLYGQQLLALVDGEVRRISLTGDRPVRLDAEWRADLPLGLPNGDVLLVRRDTLMVARFGDGSAKALLEVVDAPADAGWLPVRWIPPGARVAERENADRAPSAVGDGAASQGASVPGRPPAEGEGQEAAAVDEESEVPTLDSLGFAFGAPAAGYYAVAVASRTGAGVVELVRALARSGYPTAVQRRRDDGGQMWYRALVGPYPARERAEAAARQLRRERGLDAWVTEVTAGAEEDF